MTARSEKSEAFPGLTDDWLRRVNGLIPHRRIDSPTVRAYKLGVAALRKVFGSQWSEQYVENATTGFFEK